MLLVYLTFHVKLIIIFLCKQKPLQGMYMTVLIERDVFPYSLIHLFIQLKECIKPLHVSGSVLFTEIQNT